MANDFFAGFVQTDSKHQSIIQNYFIIQDQNLHVEDEYIEDENEKFYAFQEPCITIPDPKVSLWEFLSKEQLEELFKIRNSNELKKYLDSIKLERFQPRGVARTVFLDLMYSVAKFCRSQDYSLEKSGALMSQFYLTHILVTTAFDKSAEKVYTYFKELALCATLPDFPPKNAKIFTQEDTKRNMQYFTRIYLRNLPLIRFLSLPNFAFYCKYYFGKPKVARTVSERSVKNKIKKSMMV